MGDLSTATRHAHWIIHMEQAMGVAVEASVQRTFDHDVPMWLLSNVYLAAQLVVPPAAFIWLYRRSPRVYRALRDTVLAAWLIAIPIYALFPVAPPRLAEPGIIDTVSRQAAEALTGRSTIFYDPLAAVPSLHVGSPPRSPSRWRRASARAGPRRSRCCGRRPSRSRWWQPGTTTSSTSRPVCSSRWRASPRLGSWTACVA